MYFLKQEISRLVLRDHQYNIIIFVSLGNKRYNGDMPLPNQFGINFNISVFEILFGRVPEIDGPLLGDILVGINTILLTVFGVLYIYQIVMAFVSMFFKGQEI